MIIPPLALAQYTGSCEDNWILRKPKLDRTIEGKVEGNKEISLHQIKWF